MKSIILIAILAVLSLSMFTDDLAEKYSIEVLAEGTQGTKPNKNDNVKMHYEGKLKDGTVFDSSYTRNSPLPLRIGSGQVIKCWD